MTQRSIDRDGSAPHLPPVLDCGDVHITVFALEQVRDSGGRELMLVAQFVSEQNNITQVRPLTFFFPNNQEVVAGKLLSPERSEDEQSNLPPGELMLN